MSYILKNEWWSKNLWTLVIFSTSYVFHNNTNYITIKSNFPLCNCSFLYRYKIQLRNSSLSKCTCNDIVEQSDDVNDVTLEFSIYRSISFDDTIRKTHVFFLLFRSKIYMHIINISHTKIPTFLGVFLTISRQLESLVSLPYHC